MWNFDATCTQEEFAQLVGITRQAIAKHLEAGVLRPGETGRQWLLSYTSHLREFAAGRGQDGELAFQRSELARVSRERAEIKLALERKEYAPVALIEEVLSAVGKRIISVLEPVPNDLHKIAPELSPEVLKIIQLQIAKACDMAASSSLGILDCEEDLETAGEPDFFEGEDDE